jgi:hypothetical protein
LGLRTSITPRHTSVPVPSQLNGYAKKTIKLLCLSNKRREASTTGAIVRRLDSSDAEIAFLHILKQLGSKVQAALTWTHLCSDLTIES